MIDVTAMLVRRRRMKVPFLDWIDEHKHPQILKADPIAGIAVALVLVPQSITYAQPAGLSPYVGLYASFIPVMLVASMGSSRQLGTGPVAVVSLMTAAALQPLDATGAEGYLAYAAMLALLAGVF